MIIAFEIEGTGWTPLLLHWQCSLIVYNMWEQIGSCTWEFIKIKAQLTHMTANPVLTASQSGILSKTSILERLKSRRWESCLSIVTPSICYQRLEVNQQSCTISGSS